jgi:hypothetical protein
MARASSLSIWARRASNRKDACVEAELGGASAHSRGTSSWESRLNFNYDSSFTTQSSSVCA